MATYPWIDGAIPMDIPAESAFPYLVDRLRNRVGVALSFCQLPSVIPCIPSFFPHLVGRLRNRSGNAERVSSTGRSPGVQLWILHMHVCTGHRRVKQAPNVHPSRQAHQT